MSHSKHTRRGNSYSLDAWNSHAKRYVVACAICGRKGIDPRGLMSPSLSEWVKRELLAVGEPLELDAGGNCIECSQAVAGASSP